MRSRTAEKNVDSLMDRYNENPQSLVFSRLADEFRKEGNFSKAIEICTNGLLAHPEYVTGRIVLGQCYVEQGNPQAAVKELLTIFSYDRKNQAAMKMLADLYTRQEKLDKAGDLYTLLYRMDPGNKSLRVLAKQFRSSGFNDIYKILGLPSPQTSFNFQSKEVRPDQFSSDLNKTYVESPQHSFEDVQIHPVTEQLDMSYGTEELSSPQVSSDEIGVRMDALFGDLQTEISNPDQQNQDDSINLNFSDGVDILGDKSITGDDVTDRMNALFGDDDKKGTSSEITELHFSNSEISEISGDDISMRMDMLDQNSGIEDLSMQSFQPDFHLENAQSENDQSDIINIQADPSNSSVSGDDITDRFDNLLGVMNEENQPDFEDPLTMELSPSNEGNQISGDDISAQMEKLMPSDSFGSDLSFGSDQNTNIKENTAFTSSEGPLSGDDFTSHIEEITNSNDSLYNDRRSENSLGDDLLSTERVDLSKYTNDDVSGDDFSSHIDSIISNEATQSQSQSVADLQDNELRDDTKSVQKDDALLFNDNSDNNNLSNPDDLLIDDQNYTENLNTNSDLIVDVNERTMPSEEGMTFIGSDTENPSGEDFSNHIDKILGNDNDKFSSLNQNNLLYDSEDDSESINNSGIKISGEERVTGDDVSDHFDSMLGLNGRNNNNSIYDRITQSYDFKYDTEPTIQNDQLLSEDGSISGDDFGAHIDLISGEITQDNQSDQDAQGPDIKDVTRAFSKDELIVSEDTIRGDDFVAHIDESPERDSYTPPMNYQKNTNDLVSPLTSSEFEETLQFDRSVIERVQAEIEAKPLNAVNTPNIESDFSDELADISTGIDKYSGVENETLSFDRAELNAFIPDSIEDIEEIVEQPDSVGQNYNDMLILNVDNPSPNTNPLGEIEDVLVDHDEKIISEMDVLVSAVEDIQGVTGEDVVEKLDALFPSDSLNLESSPIPEKIIHQDFNLSNTEEMVTETVSDTIDLTQGDEDQDKANNSADLSESISGNDVEKRIDDFFNDSSISSGTDAEPFVKKSVQIDESDLLNSDIVNEPLESITEDAGIFISDEDSQIDDLGEEEAITFVDSSESSDSDVQSDFLPEVPNKSSAKSEAQPGENSNTSDHQMTSAGIDESDKPFSIPDHVLTPTLADIYYQQGQLQLAVQIYSRLLEKDPDNQKLSERLEDIQSKIALQKDETPVENSHKRKEMIENVKQVSGIIKSVPQKKKATGIERPLSGVRIKKGKKPRKPDQK
jgi:tetratricopeptide (TPR) repeat protein